MPYATFTRPLKWTSLFRLDIDCVRGTIGEIIAKMKMCLLRLKVANDMMRKGELNTVSHHIHFVTYTGRLKEFYFTVTALRDERGVPVRAVAYGRDITDQPVGMFPETPLDAVDLACLPLNTYPPVSTLPVVPDPHIAFTTSQPAYPFTNTSVLNREPHHPPPPPHPSQYTPPPPVHFHSPPHATVSSPVPLPPDPSLSGSPPAGLRSLSPLTAQARPVYHMSVPPPSTPSFQVSPNTITFLPPLTPLSPLFGPPAFNALFSPQASDVDETSEPAGVERKQKIEAAVKDTYTKKKERKRPPKSIDGRDSKKKYKKKEQPPYSEQLSHWTVPRIRFENSQL
jgi:hypothetical protein